MLHEIVDAEDEDWVNVDHFNDIENHSTEVALGLADKKDSIMLPN